MPSARQNPINSRSFDTHPSPEAHPERNANEVSSSSYRSSVLIWYTEGISSDLRTDSFERKYFMPVFYLSRTGCVPVNGLSSCDILVKSLLHWREQGG
jgi:hypothetical protein